MRLQLSFFVLCTAALVLAPSVTSAAVKRKRNNCTGTSDPDCLPDYNDYKRNATFDDLPPKTALAAYKGLTYTGFKVIKAHAPESWPRIVPSSRPNFVRAWHSSSSDADIRITSNGDVFKFKSLSFACAQHRSAAAIPCTLNISGLNPGPTPAEYRNSVILTYDGDPGSNGTATMTTVTADNGLAPLDLANYYTFQTVGEPGSTPRLYLDDIDVVYYKTFL